MSQDQWEILEGAQSPQEKTEKILQELKNLDPNEELYNCAQKVAEDYEQNPNMPRDNLNNLIKAIIKTLKDHQAKDSIWSSLPFSLPSLQNKKAKVYPVVAAQTFGADKEILRRTDVKECGTPADCDVVVVFCPVTSRVASDVNDAMRNIPGGANEKKVILVVMHHLRDDNSLPNVQLNHGHQNVIKDVHVFYHETKKGLITSGRNDEAIQDLKDLCKKLAT